MKIELDPWEAKFLRDIMRAEVARASPPNLAMLERLSAKLNPTPRVDGRGLAITPPFDP